MNIDKQVQNKFNAFKMYAEQNNIKWGFVRDRDTELYFNNTKYVDNMNDDNWRPINELFSNIDNEEKIVNFDNIKNGTKRVLDKKLAAHIDIGRMVDKLSKEDEE